MKPDLVRLQDVQADTYGVVPSHTKERILPSAMKSEEEKLAKTSGVRQRLRRILVSQFALLLIVYYIAALSVKCYT